MPRLPRPPVRADGDATREALLEAATALFGDHGFAGTSLRAVAARANANLSAVTYYFGGKTELYLACVEAAHTALMADVPPLYIGHLDLRDAFQGLFLWGMETAERVRRGEASAHRLLLSAMQEAARGGAIAPALEGLAEHMTQPFGVVIAQMFFAAYPDASPSRVQRAASLVVFNAVLFTEEVNLARYGITPPEDQAARVALANDLSDFVLAGAEALLRLPTPAGATP
jgi:AcrR family transcriptional regulator